MKFREFIHVVTMAKSSKAGLREETEKKKKKSESEGKEIHWRM